MGMLHSTVTIVENQVIFSKEILEYFESLRNEETNEWATQFILTPQELEEYKKTHSVE